MLLALALLFIGSRVILYHFFPFRVDFLPWLNQLLDVNLLQHDLWRSLWYLHATPPLYDLYVGLMLKLFSPSYLGFGFSLVQGAMGLAIIVLVYLILKHLGVTKWWAASGAFIFLIDPVLFQFEIIPFYTYLLAFLLTLSVYLFIKFSESLKISYLISFLFLTLVLTLTRNFFHIIFYFVPLAGFACYLVYQRRRALFPIALIVSVIFFAIGLVPSIKNQINYGVFSSSTWQGMQLYSMTWFVPKDKIAALVTDKKISPIVLIQRFTTPDKYYAYYHLSPDAHPTGIPAVDEEFKPSGDGNYNNFVYAWAAKEYGDAALKILIAYPQYFPLRFINSAYIFFGVGNSNYRYFDQISKWLIFDGSMPHRAFQAIKYFVLPLLFAIIFCASLWQLFRARKNPAALLMLLILLYVFGVSTVVELGENDTARAPADPVIIVAMVYTAATVVGNMRRTPGVNIA